VHLTSAHPAFDSRIFYKECQSLARAGYEVIEIATHPHDVTVGGVHIRGIGRSRNRIHRITGKLLQIIREALRFDAEIYHFHDPELLLVGVLLRAFGKRVIYDSHEYLPRTFSYKGYLPASLQQPLAWVIERAENTVARLMSGLVAANPTVGDRFRKIHHNTSVIDNFPILSEITPDVIAPWTSRDMSIAYIGSISEQRGIREILAAMNHLPARLAAKLELAGHFSPRDLLEQISTEPDWRHVNWQGSLNRQQVRDLLSRVRAGLIVLYPEGNFLVSHPIKLFEYMAAGIPVIASDFPLWREIIDDAQCGILVDPFDIQKIAAAIEYVLTHDAEAEAMGRNGRLAVEKQFNWTLEERKLLDFYQMLLTSKSARRLLRAEHAET
jgi:glycosyltransferase involved in cell wall biosynthesis